MITEAIKMTGKNTGIQVTADEAVEIHEAGDWYVTPQNKPLRLHKCRKMANHFEYEPRWEGRKWKGRSK